MTHCHWACTHLRMTTRKAARHQAMHAAMHAPEKVWVHAVDAVGEEAPGVSGHMGHLVHLGSFSPPLPLDLSPSARIGIPSLAFPPTPIALLRLVYIATLVARHLVVGLPRQPDSIFKRNAILQRLVIGCLQQVVRQLMEGRLFVV